MELAQLAERGGGAEERDQILAAHERDLQNVVNKMDADRLRMRSGLAEKLRRRREAKTADRRRHLADGADGARRELAERQRDERERWRTDEVRATERGGGGRGGGGGGGGGQGGEGMTVATGRPWGRGDRGGVELK